GDQTIIVDYKFGRTRPDYHDQVRQYADLLRQMGHTNIRGYLWYVTHNEIEEVQLDTP
ncbi:MAG: Dna2/Cas4 domain-containing protein, partial [Bacteroidaceae bacterium]|nr:Dna2/Cas4 domain-containing protein [Bacteroidaceae bacterium]